MQRTELPTEEQERQITNRIVQVLRESRRDKIIAERKIEEITKAINWYSKTKISKSQTLTNKDHDTYNKNIDERKRVRLRWEDKTLDIEYLEEETVLSRIEGEW